MVKRSYNMPNEEPEQKTFSLPSQKEHCFQISDIFDIERDPHGFSLGPDDVFVKCEVVGGEEAGRTLLHRLNLDQNWKGFFTVRLFLKAIGLEHKGNVEIDTDDFQGRQFYATVVHNEGKNGKTYANINEFNFDKLIDNGNVSRETSASKPSSEPVAWDD